MSAPAVRARGLTKHYGEVRALQDVDLTVAPGEVYGLVGRNGAGKTTLMRLLLGLVRPTAGTVEVLGRPAGSPAAAAGVGALVESPALQPHLSGRDNLRLLAHWCGASRADVDTALEQVELTDRAGARTSTYSLGMRQRLGVAAALLGDPVLVVLDEPTNGLDPVAAGRMRALVGELRGRGRTVLLSSHLLGEVEQVCDRIGVVHAGRLVAEGTLAEISASADGATRLTVHAAPAEAALRLLTAHPGVRTARTARTTEGAIEVVLDGIGAAAVNRLLVEAGVDVSELHPARRSLQDVFAGLTGDRADLPPVPVAASGAGPVPAPGSAQREAMPA